MRVRRTNSASNSIAVAPNQADLRPRASGKGPLAYWRAGQLDFLLAPRAKPRFWAVPIRVETEPHHRMSLTRTCAV